MKVSNLDQAKQMRTGLAVMKLSQEDACLSNQAQTFLGHQKISLISTISKITVISSPQKKMYKRRAFNVMESRSLKKTSEQEADTSLLFFSDWAFATKSG